ncbi:FimV/HubP family polar landmark protein [Legionella pneumophila serogroup 1]|nr:pilus assembly protein FimV [Legionella pneumophila]HEN4770491.1 pilus assembly protein FimV [Legionella pneumophila]
MKKTVLHAAIFSLTMPISLYALGLGEMKVQSSLDQPFSAEIELIDVGADPLASIKVNLADPEQFEQIGLERAAVLSLLRFQVERNPKGIPVVKVSSTERMTEPYMEIVVDLTWPKGQLYKAYTVLLDPPGYQLGITTAQSRPVYYKKKSVSYSNEPGVIEKTVITTVEHSPVSRNDSKKKTTYGPTVTNENVWQIAQRYKTSKLILPQVVLAIVGANPEAFKDGNLNGLKVGVRLVIPSTEKIAQVPSDLAIEEVMAHDKAWNEHTSINHVLAPPYINSPIADVTPQQNKVSSIPVIPKFTIAVNPNIPTLQQLIPDSTSGSMDTSGQQQSVQNNNKIQIIKQNEKIKAEISITTAAVESVRESNALLMEQLRILQEQNKKLQEKLDKREKEIELMRTQVQTMLKERQAVASQASSLPSNAQAMSLWPYIILLILTAGGAGFAYWYFRQRQQKEEAYSYKTDSDSTSKPFIPLVEPVKYEQDSQIDDKQTSISSILEQVSDSEKQAGTPVSKVDQSEFQPEQSGKTQKTDTVEYETIEQVTNLGDIESSRVKEDKQLEQEVQAKPEVQAKENEMMLEPVMEPEQLEINKEVESDDSQSGKDETQQTEDHQNFEVIEFESGLHELIKDKPKTKIKESTDKGDDSDNGIDFVPLTINEESKTLMHEREIEKSDQYEDKKSKESATKENKFDLDNSDFDIEDIESEPDLSQEEKEGRDLEITEFGLESIQEEKTEKGISISQAVDEAITTKSSSESNETSNPLKSKKALDTLLDLAKTYISMGDLETAKSSLEEVIEHGSASQKEQARQLLDQLK